jgi:hypothetical protein
MTDARDLYMTYHFAQSNPVGVGSTDVPALMRRVAQSIENHGDIDVQDIVFSYGLIDGEFDPSFTVYYTRRDEPRLPVEE